MSGFEFAFPPEVVAVERKLHGGGLGWFEIETAYKGRFYVTKALASVDDDGRPLELAVCVTTRRAGTSRRTSQSRAREIENAVRNRALIVTGPKV